MTCYRFPWSATRHSRSGILQSSGRDEFQQAGRRHGPLCNTLIIKCHLFQAWITEDFLTTNPHRILQHIANQTIAKIDVASSRRRRLLQAIGPQRNKVSVSENAFQIIIARQTRNSGDACHLIPMHGWKLYIIFSKSEDCIS